MKIKAIILAAGSGTRMGRYTENLPKGMISFNGKTLIEWQIEKLRKIGIEEIVIITGYKREAINYPGVSYYHNSNYMKTNMVESLMCAREEFNTDVIIAYSDILYSEKLIKLVRDDSSDIGVAVDETWREYWISRYGTTETDLETLSLSSEGCIKELGKPVSSSDGIKYRYIGLIKFTQKAMADAIRFYDYKKKMNESWKQSGNIFANGYMTDFLQELIDNGSIIKPVISKAGWLEFDLAEDYEKAEILLKKGLLNSLFS